ncbi:MAG: hypothetical protein IJT73_04710 [Selenomonadaceae bacterium]|nr:hypothetical protein [Selenomonadaceae bacterium]
MPQFELLQKKEKSKFDSLFKKAGEVAEITKGSLKDGIKKSATKVAGIGAAGATSAAVGKLAATGIGGVLVATGAGAAVASAVPLVVGVTTTCILDSVVKSVTESEK